MLRLLKSRFWWVHTCYFFNVQSPFFSGGSQVDVVFLCRKLMEWVLFFPGPTLNFLLHLRGALNVLLKGTGAGSQARLFTTLSLQSCLNYWVSWNIMELYTNVYMYICMYRLIYSYMFYIYSLSQWPTSNYIRESLIFSRETGEQFQPFISWSSFNAEWLTLRSYAGFYWPLPKEEAIEKSKRKKKGAPVDLTMKSPEFWGWGPGWSPL